MRTDSRTLDDVSRRKLVGILGRLGSDHDGERAAAGLLATRLLKAADLVWDDVVAAPRLARPESVRLPEWYGERALCQRHFGRLTEWERGFIRSISTRSNLTPKQYGALSRIADALRAGGAS